MYYDGAKLLSMKDINNKQPEIYICTTNRSAGKTTYFTRLLTKKFINNKEKFCIIYRYNYELDGVADKFFKEIQKLFFHGYEMTSKRQANGIFHELFLNDESCGYAVTLNSSDQIKKYSHLLSDTKRLFFDEFQSETNHYCKNEIERLISIHTSIARGGGEQVKYLPLYMAGNTVSIINPYYTALGISSRLKHNTKFLRGDGYVLECGFIDSVADEQANSGFNRAFASNKYIAYTTQNIYLNDNLAFIGKLSGRNKYLATLRYGDKNYGLRDYYDDNLLYCNKNPDLTNPNKFTVSVNDHNTNFILTRNNFFISQLRMYFENGLFRFEDAECKNAILKMLSY